MPKTEIRYDTRMQIKLSTEMKDGLEAWAKMSGMSANRAARLAIKRLLRTKTKDQPVED